MSARSLTAWILVAFVSSNVLAQQPEAPRKNPDDQIVAIFGADSAELKYPLRIWIAKYSIAIAAHEFKVGVDGNILLSGPVSIGNDPAKIIRGDKATILANEATTWNGLANVRLMLIEVHTKSASITLTPPATFMESEVTAITIPSLNPPTIPAPPIEDKQNLRVVVEPTKTVFVQERQFNLRFNFKIPADSKPGELLPTPPAKLAKSPPPLNEDLSKVPELMLGTPISSSQPKMQAVEMIAHQLAKANHLNARKTDGFVVALLAERADLRGLPFLMGEQCRTRGEQAAVFGEIADAIQQHLARAKSKGTRDAQSEFWHPFFRENMINLVQDGGSIRRATTSQVNGAIVAALTQILMPESDFLRLGLTKYLATVPHKEATIALARLAIFSPEEEVRNAAIEGLKLRREKDYTDVLLDGFRYPLPAVSKRAAEALVKLDRQDLAPQLIEVLDRPDPRLPTPAKKEGKDVNLVRELVKVNHHRNCMLCHAPGNTEDVPEGVLKVAVPIPSEPLPKPSEGGYQKAPPSSDVLVRLDMTYLRQDFSLMMPVADAHPWPEMQRFDFLVRTRELTAEEARAYRKAEDVQEGKLSPYHRSALFALRELTGRDTAPTAEAWRKLLKLPKAGE